MISLIIKQLKKVFFYFRQRQIRLREILFCDKHISVYDIPIIINNYNRLTTLLKLVSRLEEDGYRNIYILDNNSTYPPLLDYYAQSKHKIVRLGKNFGYLAFWKSGFYKQFRNQYFVYTDSDVVPDEGVPADYIQHFLNLMQKYPYASKVGFSLRIDDLPEFNSKRDDIISWESRFWQKEIEPGIYLAPIDTTFALYRPNIKGRAYFDDIMIRTGYPYIAKHLPWYNDSNHLSDEDCYYIASCSTLTHWTQLNK